MMKSFTRLLAFLAIMLGSFSMAQAQFMVSGKVTDTDNEPLIGVTVQVAGTGLGTISDLDGKFSLQVPGESGVLEFSYTGYALQSIEVSGATSDLAIVMDTESTILDEVVITGLATNVKRSNTANAVAQISSDELTGVTVQPTMDGALYGKFAGAELRSNSGAPGGGMSVRLRGVTSIFGDQQPLYIVDGVFVDNSSISLGTNIVSAAAGGGNTATNQDDASNRIADIDPADIETIDILKGASAAAIYGSRAAGGVIIITTKRGKAGALRTSFSQTFGASRPIRLLGPREWDATKIGEVFGQSAVDEFNQNGLTDYEAELYDNTGLISNSRLEFSGGSNKSTYFFGASYNTNDGIVDNTGYRKAAVRFNLTQRFTDWFDVDISSNYINTDADRGFFNNSNANTTVGYALAFTTPWSNLFADEDGNFPANPGVGSNVLETVELVQNQERINRFLGGITGNIRIYSDEQNNLKLVARAGIDQYTLRTTSLFPRSLSYFRDPSSLGGASISGTTVNTNFNLNAFLVHSFYPNEDLTFRTQIGVTQEDFDRNTVISTATDLNGSQTNIDQAANLQPFQSRRPQQDKGFFAQEEFNWRDAIIATVGIRGDKSSNNGDPNQLYWYPKANAAVNIHNLDFWTIEDINQLKVRVAYGQSGRFANFADRFNAYDPTLIEGISGIIPSTLRGNTEVGPERQAELEAGLDLGILKNRLNFSFTYYIKTIDDLLLRAQIPTSTGYTRQVLNGGELQNRGVEILMDAVPVQTEKFRWNVQTRFWVNRSEVTRLDVPAFPLGGFAAALGQYLIQEGQPATQIVGTYNPEDCGTPDCSDLDPDGDGFQVYGDAEADFNLSFAHNISFGNFDFTTLLHWKQGGDGINLSPLLWDLGNLTWDYDDTDADPTGATPNGEYRVNQFFRGNAAPWIEDAGYFRVREIGLYCNIPRSTFDDVMALRVGVSARNLINIFEYNSYDPEVSNFGNNVLANNVEVTPFPSSKIYNFHIKATF